MTGVKEVLDNVHDILSESVQKPKLFDMWSIWHFVIGVFSMWWGLAAQLPAWGLIIGLALLHCLYELRDIYKSRSDAVMRTDSSHPSNNSQLNSIGDQIIFSAGLALGLFTFQRLWSKQMAIATICILIYIQIMSIISVYC